MKERIAVPIGSASAVRINTASIPAHTATNIAQTALAAILRDYLRPEVQADYQRWKAERDSQVKKNVDCPDIPVS